jgi:hypothetical protein
MSEVLDMQVYSLLARMHETRDAGCRQLRESAEAQAREIVTEARRRARQRVKEAVLEKRRQVEEHCRQARVELETRSRADRFAGLGRRLEEGLAALPGALSERWSDPAARDSWCRYVLDGAAVALRPGRWTLALAPGLGAAEREALAGSASEAAGEPVESQEDPALEAGLVVVHDGARYDGTIRGLMADRNRVQAALLAELAALEARS